MCHLDPGDHAEAIGDPTARAPARQGPNPERKATRYSTKLHRNEVHTRLIARDHDPRRTDQCNLHTHVIANKNKSPR
eukprot:scaffold330_cov63-Phaeocystis_antarctica.AAC.1